MAKALIVIDYTYDFVADDGLLTCGKSGQAIDDAITEITAAFAARGKLVVFAVDVHDPDDAHHPETALFPPHNLRGSSGRLLYGELGKLFASLSQQALPTHVKWLDKTRYSAFTGTNLDMMLRSRGIQELHLVGVCTDICVFHTAVDAYNLGYDMVVHERAVASFNEAGHRYALTHFQSVLGARVEP